MPNDTPHDPRDERIARLTQDLLTTRAKLIKAEAELKAADQVLDLASETVLAYRLQFERPAPGVH